MCCVLCMCGKEIVFTCMYIFILKKASFQTCSGQSVSADILQLQEEISTLRKEKDALQKEISTVSINQKVMCFMLGSG